MQRYIPSTKEERDQVFEEIQKVAAIASKYGGKVYKDYVWDVLVPKHYDKNCDVIFDKEIDLMFSDDNKRDRFIETAGLVKSNNFGKSGYYKCQLVNFGMIIAEFNLISMFVICYHIQHLRAIYNGILWEFDVTGKEYTSETLIEDIKRKYVKVDKQFVDTIRTGFKHHEVMSTGCNATSKTGLTYPYECLINKFLFKDWTVELYNDGKYEYKHYKIHGNYTFDDLIKIVSEKSDENDIRKEINDLENASKEVSTKFHNKIRNLEKDVDADLNNIKVMIEKLRKKADQK